ncbi:TusA-related sulfurtransferase [Pedococcus cremeus]|uniref:TusA-related sulfurtransferase n=1 Tax=Pedococcus cremeus TaxID=587636 RepID=A0A1H9T0R2_9MICO|nr:sulfurtransferase TusA family protein [Pedococcus cremeus]SER90842.1 TusA-related sulfurtransferase [Pedococcus cremeus]
MSPESPEPTEPPDQPEPPVVDARGLRCPLPVIRLAQAAKDLPAGALVEVWATDPAARADVPAWCRMRGHELVATTELDQGTDGAHTAYRVRLGG